MAKKLKVLVKTLDGTSATQLGTILVPTGSHIMADTGDTVHIGEAGVSSSTGYLLATTPGTMKLGDVVSSGHTEWIDLSNVYVVGANTDVIRVLYVADV